MNNINIKKSKSHFLVEVTPGTDNSPECLRKWIVDNNLFLQEQLAQCGGVFFKGFKVESASDFENVLQAMEQDLSDKHIFDGAVSFKRTDFVSEVASPTIKKMLSPLSLHNEDSFVAEVPDKIMFCSLKSAPWGGESLIADCRKVYQDLPKKVQKKYKSQKLKSTLLLEDRLFLANSLIPKNLQEIKKFAVAHGAENVERISEGMTRFTFEVPTTLASDDSEIIWFNTLHQAVFYNKCIDIWKAYAFYGGFVNKIKALFLMAHSLLQDLIMYLKEGGDPLKMHDCMLVNGEKIKAWERIQMGLAFWKNTVMLPLKDGDFFILNNRLVAHGRMPYKGERIMVSAMTQPKVMLHADQAA